MLKSRYPFFLFFFSLIFLIAFADCGHRSGNYQRLQIIDSLLKVSPYEAYDSILQIDTAVLKDGRERAYYDLLYAETRYKTYHDDTIDTKVSEAAEWFNKHGERNLYSRALFQKGFINKSGRNLGEALTAFLKAEENIDTLKEPFIYAVILKNLGLLYSELGNAPAASDYAYKEYKAFKKTDSLIFIKESLEWLSTSLNNAGKCEKGEQYADSLFLLAENNGDSLNMANALLSKANSALWQEEYIKAKDIFVNLLNNYNCEFTNKEKNQIVLSLIFSKTSSDSLDFYIEMLKYNNAEDIPFEYFISKRDYEKAYLSLYQLYNSLDSKYIFRMRESAQYANDLYEKQENENVRKEMEQSHMQLIYLGILAVAFLIITLLVFYNFKIRKERHIAQLKVSLQKMSSDISSLNKQLKEKEKNDSSDYAIFSPDDHIKENKSIIHNFLDRFDKIYSSYFIIGESPQTIKKSFSAIEKEIQEIKKDKEFRKELMDWVDRDSGKIFSLITSKAGIVKDTHLKLITYLYLGFSTETICLLLEIKPDVYYNRKNRLISKLAQQREKKFESFIEKLRKTNNSK